LTFDASNWNVAQSVTVTGLDDSIVNGDQTYQVNGTASSSDAIYNGLAMTPVTVVNKEADSAGIAVSPASLTTSETGMSASFTVNLTSKPIAPVTINLSTSVAGQGSLSTSVLTFDTTNWNVAHHVIVTGLDDHRANGDQIYSVTGTALSATAEYDGRTFSVEVINKEADVAQATPARDQRGTSPAAATVTGAFSPGKAIGPAPAWSIGNTSGSTPNQAATTPTPTASHNDIVVPPENAGSGTPFLTAHAGGIHSSVVMLVTPLGRSVMQGSSTNIAITFSFAGTRDPSTTAPTPADAESWAEPVLASRPLAADRPLLRSLPSDDQARSRSNYLMCELAETADFSEGSTPLDEAGVAAVTGVLATAGYVLFNTRAGSWLLSLLTAKALWKDFDPIEVLFAWEKEQLDSEEEDREETLLSLVK
jgi:hypothetical protein